MITGGGAMMNGVAQLVNEIFGLPCLIGEAYNMGGAKSITGNPEYAVCCGLIQHGIKASLNEKDSFFGMIKNLLGK